MEKLKLELTEKPKNVKEAVETFLRDHDIDKAIRYLREHREDVTEFCLQVVEAYRNGDNSGVIDIAFIIKSLL